jgi:hypothetical protein
MPDKFDPYREALVMETETLWPEEYANWDPHEKQRVAAALHADAERCQQLEYVRTHTGFCRKIIVTADDVERVASGA